MATMSDEELKTARDMQRDKLLEKQLLQQRHENCQLQHDASIDLSIAIQQQKSANRQSKHHERCAMFAKGRAVVCTPPMKQFVEKHSIMEFRIYGPNVPKDNWDRVQKPRRFQLSAFDSWQIDRHTDTKWELTMHGVERYAYRWDDKWIGRWIQQLNYY